MIVLVSSLAFAGAPRHHQLDATLGMRAGAAATVTVEPRPHLEVGGRFHVSTDVYAGAPSWVRSGLDPKHNLYFTPMAVAGVSSGPTTVSGALLFGVGAEVFTFNEQRTVAALSEPVSYSATGVRPGGAMMLDLRIQPKGGPGGHLMLSVPLPLSPSGSLYYPRMHFGLGVSF